MKKVNSLIFVSLMSLSLIMTSCDKKKQSDVPDNEYTIKFVDYDNYLLSTIQVKEGTIPVYDGEEPFRDPTKEYQYTFTGWTPEIVAAKEDTTYKATYSEEVRTYTVRFINDDGTELQKESLPYGATPSYKGSTPTKEANAQYTYTFKSWDNEIVKVDKNATYTATYSSVVNTYTVTFDSLGGTPVASQTVAYGDHVQKPADPTKDRTAESIYVFTGWDFDFENTIITGNTNILATWYEVNSNTPHGDDCVYLHYPKYMPEDEPYGYEEFWYCPVHHQFVMVEPTGAAYILEAPSLYDDEILSTDERFISLIYDENHLSLEDYSYGAGMYSINLDEFQNYKIEYGENEFDCLLYSENDQFYTWRIDLPRIDYTRYRIVTIDVNAPDWYQPNTIGPELNDLCYQTVYGGNKDKGKIKFSYKTTGLEMEFNSIEYANQVAFTKTITDDDIVHGLKPAYFYLTDKWDRHIIFSNITISTEKPIETTDFTFGGDTSKLTVQNANVYTPGSIDYSIISNGYGTNETSLLVEGNANPGAAVITLPGFNFNQYTPSAEILFTFGIYNKSEHMYFGSGSTRVDLGTNSPTSQSNNNNGYVNWLLVVRNDGAYIYNKYEDHNYTVTLTQDMKNGTTGLTISGGDTSIYRRYLVTDFCKRAY